MITKKYRGLIPIILLALVAVFSLAACSAAPNDEKEKEEPSDTKVTYEISVDAENVTVDTGEITVCLYDLDGTSVGEKKLSRGKTLFELEEGSYLATLGGLPESVSYSSVLLTENSRKATIVLEEAEYDGYTQSYAFSVTVVMFADGWSLEELSVQFCDDNMCRPVWFETGNVADIMLGCGEYEVKVYANGNPDELYHEDYTVTLNRRFCVIFFEEHTHTFGDFETVRAADCKTKGERKRVCFVCAFEDIEVIPATGHDWSEFVSTIPAKCEVGGEKKRTCSVCGDEEIEDIPALEHVWSEYTETLPAKCGIVGEKARVCALCGDLQKVEIPALEHVWTDEVILKEATCVEEGLRSVRCELCGDTLTSDAIPALGHTPGRVLPFENPTCEEPGLNIVTCAVCGKNYNEYPPATGHSYSEEFTIDRAPTIDAEGEQSRHCTNYKCTSRTDIQSIPRLINEAYFRINIVRGENQTVLPTTYTPMIRIVDEAGKTVVTTFVFGDSNKEHIFEKLLPFGTYTVKIINELPEGFECGEYTISEQDGIYPYDTPEKYPAITMHLYSHLGTGTMSNGDKKNTVLNDFSVTTIDGVTVRLSDLLKEKKLVWLNFYYNDCYPCQSEAPEIVRLAKLFDVAVICFNNRDSVEDMRSAAKNIFKFPDTFYLVQDSGDAYGKLFGRYAYPMNVFIDSGGCVFESVTGSNYSSQFYNYINNNLFETPEKEDAFATVKGFEAILPDKRAGRYQNGGQDE